MPREAPPTVLVRVRQVPHARAWSGGLRAVHAMAFGLLLGGHAWDVDAARLVPALWLTVATGVALMGLEVYKTPYWLVMGKGVAVLIKLALLVLVPVLWDARLPLLLLVVAVASVGAHMPARYRHYSLVHRRLLAPAPGRSAR